MSSLRARSHLRGGVCLLAVIGVCLALTWWLLHAVTRLASEIVGPTPASPAQALTLLTALAALGVAVWLSVGVVVSLLGELPGPVAAAMRTARDRWCPTLATRVASLLLGAAVGSGLATGTALAAPVSSAALLAAADPCTAEQTGQLAAPVPAWTPTRPRPPAPVEQVVVRPGDTLWDLARDHLRGDAPAAEVARAWPIWYAANRETIGDDPDMLMPGQRLIVPGRSS